MKPDPLIDLLSELITLTLVGARQSTALGHLLVDKGLVTQAELDEYMQLSADVTENAVRLAREWRAHSRREGSDS